MQNFIKRSSSSSSSGPVFAVVMAGGAGTRLWPESRAARPKPFLPLAPDGRNLLRATLDRLGELVPPSDRFVVAGRAFGALVADAAPELGPERILLEPIGRDTAPCVLWAALEAVRVDPDATTIVLPSDHWIEPDDRFRATLARAVRLVDADPNRLVVLGVRPSSPSSAYGYIEVGAPLGDADDEARAVASFREKPDEKTAREFLATGRFLWNAGIFVWKARRILELIARFEPDLGAGARELSAALDQTRRDGVRPEESAPFQRAFERLKRISIDRAVLERASDVAVLPADAFAWDDLGSFAALERFATERDAAGNGALGASVVAENAARNSVRVVRGSGARKLVALVDVDGLLVVDSGDALLVARKGSDEALRKVVAQLKERGADEFL